MASSEINVTPQITTTQHSNVVVLDEQKSSSPTVSPSANFNGFEAQEGHHNTIIDSLSNRFMNVKTVKWVGTNGVNTNISTLVLPYDLFTNRTGNVLMQAFRPFAYVAFDMEFRIILNSNRFQVGQIQHSVYYGGDFDATMDYRNNICSTSQRPNVKQSAGINNTTQFLVPFKFVKPYMHKFKEGGNFEAATKMCHLDSKIVAPLETPDSVSNFATVTYLVRIVNIRTLGMRSPIDGLISHEMFATAARALISGAECALKQLGKDLNRDKPSNPAQKQTMVPWGSHSWCVGKNQVEEVNTLRLDILGQTPHVNPTDEMSVQYVAGKSGMIDFNKTWSFDQAAESKILEWKVNPFQTGYVLNNSAPDQQAGKLELQALAPVGVLASSFAYWRGSLIFEFDFISTLFHSGRVAVSFVPGDTTRKPTFEEAMNSYVVYFDLGEKREFSFKCPFILDKPWCPSTLTRRFQRSKTILTTNPLYASTGWLTMWVINPLVPMENVVRKVRIISYLRADTDFEVAVPVAPIFGVSYNILMKPSIPGHLGFLDLTLSCVFWSIIGLPRKVSIMGKDITFTSDNEPILIGNTNLDFPVPIVGKNTPEVRAEPHFYVPMPLEKPWFVPATSTDPAWTIGALIYVPLKPQKGEPALKKDWAIMVVDEVKVRNIKTWSQALNNVAQFIDHIQAEGAGGNLYGGKYWVERKLPMSGEESVTDSDSWEQILPVNHEGEDSEVVNPAAPMPVMSMASERCFGEAFSDLKDVMRRYQEYDSFTFQIPKGVRASEVVAEVPIYPSGLTLPTDFRRTARSRMIAREGIIPLLGSAYRFARGSLRFKLVVKSSIPIVVGVAHIPDEYLKSTTTVIPQVAVTNYATSGYAKYWQSTKTNEILEFEVPFYVPGDYVYNGEPKLSATKDIIRFTSLGKLQILLIGDSEEEGEAEAYLSYAIGDDFRFSCFQGFPMITVPNYAAYPENKSKIVHEMDSAQHEGVVDTLFGRQVNEITQRVEPTLNKAEDLITKFGSAFDGIHEQVMGMLQKAEGTVGSLASAGKQFLINIFSAIAQCIATPTLATLVIQSVTVIAQLGVISFESIGKIIPFFSRILKRAFGSQEQDATGTENTVNHEMDESEMAGFLATTVSTVAATAGFALGDKQPPKKMMQGLLNGMGKFAYSANHLTTFFKNNLKFFLKIYNWIIGCFDSKKQILLDLIECEEELKDWAVRAYALVDPAMLAKIEVDQRLQQQVFEVACVGRILSARILATPTKFNATTARSIQQLHLQIMKLESVLIRKSLFPYVKVEPWVFYVTGEANIGKSYFVNNVVKNLLDKIGHKSYEDDIFVRSTDKYWTLCKNQPFCIFDDFNNLGGDSALQQFADLYALKSTSVFVPPMAAVEDKDKVYNPLGIGILSNTCFPRHGCLVHPEALYRRRDILVHARLDPKYTSIKKVPKEVLKVFGHLQFVIQEDVLNESFSPWEQGAIIDYGALMEIMQEQFLAHFEEKMEKYREDVRNKLSRMPNMNGYSFDDSIKEVKEFLRSMSDTRNLGKKEFFEKVCNMNDTTQQTIHGVTHQNDEKSQFRPIKPNLSIKLQEEVEKKRCKHNILLHQDVLMFAWDKGEEFGTYTFFEGEKEVVLSEEPCGGVCSLQSSEFQSALMRKLDFVQFSWRDNDETTPSFARKKSRVTINIASLWENRDMSLVENHPMYKVRRALKYGLCALGACAGIFGLFQMFKYMRSGKLVNEETASESFEQEKIQGARKMIKSGKSSIKETCKRMMDFDHQSVSSCQQIDQITRLIVKNYRVLRLMQGEQELNKIKVLMFRGHWGLTHRHFWEAVQFKASKLENVTVQVVSETSTVTIRDLSYFKLIHSKQSSLSVVRFPSSIPPARDITKHFATDEHFHEIAKSECSYLRYDPSESNFIKEIKVMTKVQRGLEIAAEPSSGVTSQYLEMGYVYDVHGRGACGNLLVTHGPQVKIIGIHVAGGDSVGGIAQPIFANALESFKGNDFTIPEGVDTSIEHQEYKPSLQIPDGNMHIIGTIDPLKSVRAPTKTNIVKSPLYNKVWKTVKEPCPLTTKDTAYGDSPLRTRIEKYAKTVPIDFPKEILQEATRSCCENICQTVTKISVGTSDILSDEQAFQGIHGYSEYKALNVDTSEGYPLCLSRPKGCNNKSWLFEFDKNTKELYSINPLLQEKLEENRKLREQGKQPLGAYVLTLKDEKKDVAKLQEPGSTRVFAAGPIEILWEMKKYFGHFQAAFQTARPFHEAAVGTDPDGPGEWANMTRWITNDGEFSKFFDGDYSSFGDIIQVSVLKQVGKIIRQWYREQFSLEKGVGSDLVRKQLWNEMLYAPRLCMNVLLQFHCGIPSGFYLTVEANSIANMIIFRCCYLLLRPSKSFTATDFTRHVRILTYGDDILAGVSEKADWFNFKNVQNILSEHRIKFTSSQKDGSIYSFRDLYSVTFLKRTFSRHPTRPFEMVGKLPLESALESLNWMWDGNDPEAFLFESGRSCLRALYAHGPNVYEQWRRKIIQAIQDTLYQCYGKSQSIRLDTWYEMDSHIFENIVSEAADKSGIEIVDYKHHFIEPLSKTFIDAGKPVPHYHYCSNCGKKYFEVHKKPQKVTSKIDLYCDICRPIMRKR